MTWQLSIESEVAVLRFEHPPTHVATYADLEELEGLLHDAAATAAVVVVTGAAPDVFIAHADLHDLLALREGRPTTGDGGAWARVLRLLDRGPMISIAAVNGQAWGGGCELALTCNLRWMAEEATLAFPEVALGIVPGVGAHRAVRLLPEHVAFELLAGGRPITAARALALALVNAVVPGDELLRETVAFGATLAARPRKAVEAVRELVVGHRDDAVRDLQRRQIELFMELLASEEAGARLAAAQERYDSGAGAAEALDVQPSN